jgi:type I restriction enzyme S subunit
MTDPLNADSYGELPPRWHLVPLRALLREAQAGFACGKRDPQGIIQLRMNNVDTHGNFVWDDFIRVPADPETSDQYQLVPGDVLFNNTNSTELVGKSALFKGHIEPVVYSNHFTRLRTRPDRLLPALLAAWLNHQWRQGFFAKICNRWIGQSSVKADKLLKLDFPLPPLPEQERIAAVLREKLAAVERARAASEARLEALDALMILFIRQSLKSGKTRRLCMGDCLTEIRRGIGSDWSNYRVIGATREGLAPAKERIGKNPERYKLVDQGTVFYNPMRIIIGSIALVDEGDSPGITSPDYVVIKGKPGVLDTRWFYHWFRSPYGSNLIDSLARGAVRERILFNRLAGGEIELPSFADQKCVSSKLKEIQDLRLISSQQSAAASALPTAILRLAFRGAL